MMPGPRWRSSQHELLQQLSFRPGLEATGPSVVDGVLAEGKFAVTSDDLGVATSLEDQESSWKPAKEGGFFSHSHIASLLPA